MAVNGLTPSEELALDLLAARFRLGETVWTFRARQAPVLRRLEARGLIFTMHGITDGTLRASLTDAGKAHELSEAYIPPILLAESSTEMRLLD
jgi:hypothetical protein